MTRASRTASGGRRGSAGRHAAIAQSAAALLWLPQAALIAYAVGAIAAGNATGTAWGPAAGVLALGFVRAGLDAAGGRLAFRRARAFLSERRAEAAAALARSSPLDTERTASGSAASAIGEQAEAIVPYLSRYLPARLKATIVPVAILLCVVPFSWAAALVLLVAMPLIPLFMALIGWRAKAASEAQLLELGGMNGFLLDRLRGLATIRSLGAVDATATRLRADAERLKAKTMAVLRIAFLSSAVLELFAALGVAMVAVYVGFHLLGTLDFGAWGGRLTLGEGLFILLLAPSFFEPLRELSAVWHDRAAGEAALEALDGLAEGRLALPGADDAADHEAEPLAAAALHAPAIRIEGLRFGHAGAEAPVFSGFDLAIRPGERVALLGASGSGKSTLLSLIAGLAPADGGRIAMDGRPLDEESAAALRTRMAWIGQRPHVFAGTLLSNVAMGRPDVGRKEAEAALRFAALEEVGRTHGAAIGEGGTGLSGGEGLRLAIARAAADPGADLILADEPTAHLDSATAAEIAEALLSLAAGRTLLVATHDPVLAARMDRIVRLGSEKLRESLEEAA